MLKVRVASLAERLGSVSTLAWIVAGFMLSYLLFFFFPVFLADSSMRFPLILPTMTPIGADLRETLTFVQAWLRGRGTPYIGTATYPPLSYVVLRPLLFLDPSQRYLVFSSITLICYAVATFLLPLRASLKRKVTPELLLVFATGLMSYGLQFELERGQFNVIAIFLVYVSIWIYHSGKGREIWAYAVFSLSVQLKLYPLVFIVMFIRDWRDWKNNVRRLLLLGMGNFALLFVLGWRVFLDFVNAIRAASMRSDVISVFNHSIHSFVGVAATIVEATGHSWSAARTTVLEIELFAIMAICLALIVLKSWRDNRAGINAELLVGCAVAALVIPTVSYDYTLTILAGPVGLLLLDARRRDRQARYRIQLGLVTLLFSFAYSSILVPLSFKPARFVLQNSLPALFVMIIADVFISLWLKPSSRAAPEL